MTELLTAAQMRAIEQAAIASGEVTGLELMERAGRGVVEAIFQEWPELRATSHRAVVLCGPGNNGGDGFVVARLLKEWGWEVEVFLYGDPERMPPDARENYERWVGMGEVRKLTSATLANGEQAQLVIDAVFGTGLMRPVTDEFRIVSELAAECSVHAKGKVVSVDAPSGLCLDSGRPLRDRAEGRDHLPFADLTVTFHALKCGHVLAEGPLYCGKVVKADIGLATSAKEPLSEYWPPQIVRLIGTSISQGLVLRWLGKSRPSEHKYSHGHALILSGPSGRGGAARLAARGALRIGAGVVTVGCPPEAIPESAARLDAIMLRPIHDADALARVLEDQRINALCLGPGMGISDETAALVAQGVKSGRPIVLDADALTLIARDPSLFAALHQGCVLTPHAGEFARLFPDIAEKLAAPATKGPAYSKVDATREAAQRAGCVVLFKGPDTVIADPSGRSAINSAYYDRAAPWLATAGSGDVLAGFITGLLARGFSPFDAACTAAWLHVECALSFGPGLIAEDLPEELPKVFRTLGL
jgi:hydroxyethylthiazole kinase-like uncharacterized protein yjeF